MVSCLPSPRFISLTTCACLDQLSQSFSRCLFFPSSLRNLPYSCVGLKIRKEKARMCVPLCVYLCVRVCVCVCFRGNGQRAGKEIKTLRFEERVQGAGARGERWGIFTIHNSMKFAISLTAATLLQPPPLPKLRLTLGRLTHPGLSNGIPRWPMGPLTPVSCSFLPVLLLFPSNKRRE